MDRFFRALRPLYRFVARAPLGVVVVGLVLAVVAGLSARSLRIDSDLANLLPPETPSVQALMRLREEVGAESDAAVAIVSHDPAASVRFAEALIPRAMALRADDGSPFFARSAFRRDTRFMRRNALYFATDAELDEITGAFRQLSQRVALQQNPFYFDLDPATPQRIAEGRQQLRDEYARIVGQELAFSPDSTVLVVRFFPAEASSVARIDALYASLDSLLAAMRPAAYAPGMTAVSAGRLLLTSVETHAITDDVMRSFGSGVALVLAIVVGYFAWTSYRARRRRRFDVRAVLGELARAPVLAVVITVPLLASLAWTAGVTAEVYGALNLMTTTLGLVLFGMGIDYGVHFYTRYAEERRRGRSPEAAAFTALDTTGEAITTTALTTALAFYIFQIADFRGFSEFGFIAGTGILFALAAMLLLLPALLVLAERLRLLHLGGSPAEASAADAPEATKAEAPAAPERVRAPGLRVAAGALAVLASLVAIPKLGFETDFSRLEPEYTAYDARAAPLRTAYSNFGRRNPAYFITDTPDEVPALVAALEARRAEAGAASTIGAIESLQARFPTTPAAQASRLARLDTLRRVLADTALHAASDPDLRRIVAAAQTRAPIPLDSVPEDIRRTFTTTSGDVGRFVVVYPRGDLSLSDGTVSARFKAEVGTVEAGGKTYHAGSTSLIAADMLALMREEAPLMVGLALLLVVVFKVLALRSFTWATLSLVPLLAGLVATFGVMEVVGWQLNVYNLVVLPALLGIGDDAGIHLVHRHLEEGRGSMPHVVRTTGQAVLVSGLTTLVGFGGQILSFHPGLRSIGEVAGLGIGLTVLAALVFLPGLVQLVEDRQLRQARRPASWHRAARRAAEADAEALEAPSGVA